LLLGFLGASADHVLLPSVAPDLAVHPQPQGFPSAPTPAPSSIATPTPSPSQDWAGPAVPFSRPGTATGTPTTVPPSQHSTVPPSQQSTSNDPPTQSSSTSTTAPPPAMSFAANAKRLALGAPLTITATLSKTLSAPYHVELRDLTTGSLLTNCAMGTFCASTARSTTNATHSYGAVLLSGNTVLAPSSSVSVEWATPRMTFVADNINQPKGGTVHLTATLDLPIDNSVFFVRLFDATTNTVLQWNCTTGTTCTASYWQNYGIDNFGAHLDSGWGGPAPYPIVQSSTVTVSWPPPPVH
jgi:hypothetical protein